MSSNTPSGFGEFESALRREHGLHRERPQALIASRDEEMGMTGAMQLLTRTVITPFWNDMHAFIDRAGGMEKAMRVTYPDLDHVVRTNDIATSCRYLSEQMVDVLKAGLRTWLDTVETMSIADDFDLYSTFMNYKAALLMGGSRIGYHKPFDHLFAGLKTGVTESWRMVGESCRLYEEKEGRKIDAASLREIAGNSFTLLAKIAGSHLRVLSNYTLAVNEGNIFHLSMPQESPFKITGNAPERRLDMTEETMRKIGDMNFVTNRQDFSGCPALYVRTKEGGPNLVEDLHFNIVLPSALKNLQPHLHQA
jgi:hypothetical protein